MQLKAGALKVDQFARHHVMSQCFVVADDRAFYVAVLQHFPPLTNGSRGAGLHLRAPDGAALIPALTLLALDGSILGR